MPSYEIETSDGVIHVWHTSGNERDRVTVDGATVSETEKSGWRAMMDHEFRMMGSGASHHYELRNAGLLGFRLRRDGVVVAERYSLVIGFALALLFVGLPFSVLADLLPLVGTPGAAVEVVEELGFWASLAAANTTPWWLRPRVLGERDSAAAEVPAPAVDQDTS